jgi:phytoene dehydrogenase-like protein
MVVHLPDGRKINRWTENERWLDERKLIFGLKSEPFWQWQEKTADILWNFAHRNPEWPPKSIGAAINLMQTGFSFLRDRQEDAGLTNLAALAPYIFLPVSSRLKNAPDFLRLFIDGQLLISAQETSQKVNALYGAAALDLPRRGVASVPGGMGAMADKLVQAVSNFGGKVLFRKEVTSVAGNFEKGFFVRTKRGEEFFADAVVLNQTPWNAARLIEANKNRVLSSIGKLPADGWGAFVIYAGVDSKFVPRVFPEHHQIIQSEPLGEGESVFLSISPAWDKTRAPEGKRAVTISTHTRLGEWWNIYRENRPEYEERKASYTERIIDVVQKVFPGLSSSAELVLPGSPVTFQRFTRREKGWVGGFPQTNLFRTWDPKLAPGLWLVGDSIFPGQSVPAVTLGGLRVAERLIGELIKMNRKSWFYNQRKAGKVRWAG